MNPKMKTIRVTEEDYDLFKVIAKSVKSGVSDYLYGYAVTDVHKILGVPEEIADGITYLNQDNEEITKAQTKYANNYTKVPYISIPKTLGYFLTKAGAELFLKEECLKTAKIVPIQALIAPTETKKILHAFYKMEF